MDRDKGISTGTPEDLALSGHLSGFFSRKGIIFDTETGLFRINNQYKSEIRLVGEGQKYAMARKALQRNGIHADSGIESARWIDAGDPSSTSFVLHDSDGQIRRAATIEELLLQLES